MNTFSGYLEIEHIYSQTLGKGIKTVAVAAANPGEGCSTVACALADRHQESGASTLLVDMNFYRPSLDARYNLPRANWDLKSESFSRSIINVSPGVNVLTASRNSAMDFRRADLLQEVILRWREHFDAIVIDTSPLNSINRNNAQAELFCASVEATLLVVKSGVTTEADLISAQTKLQKHNVNILGMIMNDIECPTLAQELIREANRLRTSLPRLAHWLEGKIRQSRFLNLPV